MISLQEELDWSCYHLYGLTEEAFTTDFSPEIALGERAFEIVLARRMADGEETTWFTRHGSTAITEVPAHWPEGYRQLVERRIALIESDRNIRLIERPEYKRRWNSVPWEELEQAALRSWLLDRLEGQNYWNGEPQLRSVAKLVDAIRLDADLMQVGELYAGRSDFDAAALVVGLIESESVPFLPADSAAIEWIEAKLLDELSGEKARRWQEEVGDVPVPPKYKSSDFKNSTFWRLRGGLDVPKERFVSFPYCSRDADRSLVIAWAGWDHYQQATAIASYYLQMKENEGWPPVRLKPLLTGLQELVPWLKQWHNEYSSVHATRMGDYFESFVFDEARALGFTIADLCSWTPPAVPAASRSRRKKQATS